MSKVKVYKVYPKNNPDLWYLVEAPNKRIAKWCGVAILDVNYCGCWTAKDMLAERYKEEE